MARLEPNYCEARHQSDSEMQPMGSGALKGWLLALLKKEGNDPLPAEQVRQNRLASDRKDLISVFLYQRLHFSAARPWPIADKYVNRWRL